MGLGWIGEIWRRVVGLVRRDSMARELEEEMRLHREIAGAGAAMRELTRGRRDQR